VNVITRSGTSVSAKRCSTLSIPESPENPWDSTSQALSLTFYGYTLVNSHMTMEISTMLLMGKLIFSIAIFNSKLLVYQRVYHGIPHFWTAPNTVGHRRPFPSNQSMRCSSNNLADHGWELPLTWRMYQSHVLHVWKVYQHLHLKNHPNVAK